MRTHSLITGNKNPDEDYPVPQFGGSDFLPGDGEPRPDDRHDAGRADQRDVGGSDAQGARTE